MFGHRWVLILCSTGADEQDQGPAGGSPRFSRNPGLYGGNCGEGPNRKGQKMRSSDRPGGSWRVFFLESDQVQT